MYCLDILGGAFDYDCFKISQFAEELQNKIDENSKKAEHESLFSSAKISEDTLDLLQIAQKAIEYAGKLAHEIEWFYSGDIGEETLAKRIAKIKFEGDNE